MKVGIIRCRQTEDACPGNTDFGCARNGQGAFEGLENAEVVGFTSCGGCPGKRAVARARLMVDRGAKIIFLGSCIQKGNPFQFPCPHFTVMRDAVLKSIEGKAKLVDWTH